MSLSTIINDLTSSTKNLRQGNMIISGNKTFTGTTTFANPPSFGLTASAAVTTDALGAFNTLVLTDGQVVVGSTGSDPVAADITGTSDQVTVTNGSGSITLGTPQNIAPTSDVAFNSVTSANLTANTILLGNASKVVTSATALTNGQLLIGSTGVAPVASAITGTTDQVTVTNGTGSITLSTPQDIGLSSSPSFARLFTTDPTYQLSFSTGGSKDIRVAADITNTVITYRLPLVHDNVDILLGQMRPVPVGNVDTLLQLTDSGTLDIVTNTSGSSKTITIPGPSLASGSKFTFIVGGAGSLANDVSITSLTLGRFYGNISVATGTPSHFNAMSLVTIKAGSDRGDRYEFICDGSNWFLTASIGNSANVTVA